MKDIIQIIPNDKDHWLQEKELFIGGSELPAMLGLDRWTSPYQLWERKTGRAEPFEDNKHTLAGKFLEDGIAKYWEFETGNKIIKLSDNDIIYKHSITRICS